MASINDRNFLREVIKTLQDKQIAVWLFGGWAEELHGLSIPRRHKDVDLLYPETDFRRIDSFLRTNTEWQEIVLKRFPHKRAALFHGVVIELILIQKDEKGYFTRFFDRLRFDWPGDTLGHVAFLNGMTVNATSGTALREYRKTHATIREACREYLAK